MNVLSRAIILFSLLVGLPARLSPVLANSNSAGPRLTEQESGSLVLSAPDTGEFPIIHFRLDAYGPKGEFIANLKAAQLQIQEDGKPVQTQSIGTSTNGLQIIIALNLGPALANKVEGKTEYERIQSSLASWARSQSNQKPTGEFSLATPTGMFLIRSENPTEWPQAIQDYQPNLARAQPTLSSLAEALDLATDSLNNPFMRRSIVYITPALSSQNNETLPELASRARQIGVRVNVWLMAPPAVKGTDPAAPLRSLAEVTGGQFAQITPGAPLPALEPLFQPLRTTYQISYQSAIQKSGVHKISLRLNQQDLTLESNELSFELAVQPPNPIFLSPPAKIERVWETTGNSAAPALAPSAVPLQILVEFPDQHPRSLAVTRLYVNDTLVDENTQEPFDRFSWPVDSLTSPSRQMLRVEAVDTLGISGASLEIPVELLVEQPARLSLFDHISGRGMIAISAVVVAGSVLVLVMFLTSHQRQGSRKRQPADNKKMKDPLTQPVPVRQDKSQPRKTGEPTSRPAPPKTAWSSSGWSGAAWLKTNGQSAPARLVALDENEHPVTGGAIPLNRQEITFGSDPLRATQLLDSPTVDGLHARLYRSPEGEFLLCDQNSVAGTWINYEPVNSSATRLAHGDLIHIGRIMFRFEWIDPGQAPLPEVKVTDLEQRP